MPQDDKRKRSRAKLGGAAGGETGAAQGASSPSPAAESPTSPAPSPILASDTTKPAAQTEWTVSDRRGPLSAAAPEDDVERVVPGSETDGVGAPDNPTLHHGVPEPSTAMPSESLPSEPAPSGSGEADAVSDAAAEPHPEPSPTVLASETHVDPDPHADRDPVHVTPESDPTSSSTAAAASHEAASHPGTTPPLHGAETASRRSLVPLLVGLVIGALVGAGSAALVYWLLAGSDRTGQVDPARVAALSSRVDALDKRPDPQPALAALKRQIDDIAVKVAALDQRSGAAAAPAKTAGAVATAPSAPSPTAPSSTAPPASDPALVAKITALQASLDAVQKQSGVASRDVAGKLDALQAAVTAAQAVASTARTNADAVKGQQQALEGRISTVQSTAGAAQKQAATAQSGVDAVQSQQATLAGKLGAPALAVVADSLVTQVAGGKPFAAQVDALTALGADPVKVVVLRQNAASGVASAQSLLASFAPLAEPILATARTAPAGAGFAERLKHGLLGLVSVRRTDTTTGSDLPSRVATIQADLAHDDVPGAYAAWDALPPEAKQRSQTWGMSAKASTETVNAARGLQAEAIGALAAKKS